MFQAQRAEKTGEEAAYLEFPSKVDLFFPQLTSQWFFVVVGFGCFFF